MFSFLRLPLKSDFLIFFLPGNALLLFLPAGASEPSFHAHTHTSSYQNLQLYQGFYASLFTFSGKEYFCHSLLNKGPEIHLEPVNVLYVHFWQEGFMFLAHYFRT